MTKPTVFIGSSSGSVRIAESVKKGLVVRGCGCVQVWNQGIFGLNRGFLETLLEAVKRFDFAVLIWSADDAVNSQGRSQESPRDNVVFETGLFMGAMGRDRVFVVFDAVADLKIPSDFAGITLAEYDGVAFENVGYSAVQGACKKVAKAMSARRLPQLVGEWKSRYCKAAYSGHSVITDDVDIAESKGGVVITSRPRADAKSYSAHGRLSKPQQIVGEWQHEQGNSFIEGLFVLTINQAADQMYGYCTARDETDALVFETWILAKKDGRSESEVNEALLDGELTLRRRTLP
jgi:Predicted nucleotide-binding protein containing TIR-like domain